jgi:maleylacetate reductase
MISHGLRTYNKTERVHYGSGAFEKISDEVGKLGGSRALALVSKTLRTKTDLVDRLEKTIGGRLAGVIDGIPAHNTRENIIRVTEQARALNADLILTFGGGSIMDCGQAVRLCLEHGVKAEKDLDPFRVRVQSDGAAFYPEYRSPTIPQIAIATTLSAAEFNPIFGSTDTRRKIKEIFREPGLAAKVIILDPDICTATPLRLWLSTGIRALDHCIETIMSPRCDPYSQGPALQGIRLLCGALPAAKRDPNDAVSRMNGLFGAWLSADHNMAYVPMGASHGIGHMLGGILGMAHGDTSCIMLPKVMAFNKPETPKEQAMIAEAMGRPNDPAYQVVQDFVSSLGLPTQLSELGVSEQDLAPVASAYMESPFLRSNPRPFESEEQILDLLRQAL